MNTRYFALISGIIYLVAGVFGFIPGMNSMPPAHAPALAVESSYGYLFGLFPVNALHNIVHLAIGIWGVSAYRNFSMARAYSRGLAVIYALLTVMGLIPVLNVTFGLIPLFGHDIWLHAVTAAVAAYFGFSAQEAARGAGSGSKTVHG